MAALPVSESAGWSAGAAPAEVGAGEVGAGEVGAGEAGAGEVGAGEVGEAAAPAVGVACSAGPGRAVDVGVLGACEGVGSPVAFGLSAGAPPGLPVAVAVTGAVPVAELDVDGGGADRGVDATGVGCPGIQVGLPDGAAGRVGTGCTAGNSAPGVGDASSAVVRVCTWRSTASDEAAAGAGSAGSTVVNVRSWSRVNATRRERGDGDADSDGDGDSDRDADSDSDKAGRAR